MFPIEINKIDYLYSIQCQLTAISRILPSIIAEISSGVNNFSSEPILTFTTGLLSFITTENGKYLMSCWTNGSSNSRPINRLIWNIVSRKMRSTI